MRKMKDSGVAWIGEIPEDWCVTSLKRVGDIQGGVGFPVEEQGNQNEELPFYKVADLELASQDGIFLERPQNSISLETSKKLHAKIIKENSIVYAKIGAALLLNRRRIIKYQSIIDNNMSSIHPFYEYDLKWLYYLMCHIDFDYYVNPGTIPALSEGTQGKIIIPIPAKNNQSYIANYLDAKCSRIDSTIANIRTLIEKLKEYKQSVITQAVTKGLNPEAPMKDSGVAWIGEIPEDWQLQKIKFLARCNNEVLSENTPPSELIKYIDISSVSEKQGILLIQDFIFSNAPSRARRIIHEGDVIISTVRTYLRAVAYIYREYDNYICSTGFAVLSSYNDKIINRFLFFSILSDNFISRVESLSTGISYPAITSEQLVNIKICLPSIVQQQQIVTYLDTKCAQIDSQIAEQETLLTKLESYKKSLIYECVTGKREVPAA